MFLIVLPKVKDFKDLPFHKLFRSVRTVPLVDFVYDLKIFNDINYIPVARSILWPFLSVTTAFLKPDL